MHPSMISVGVLWSDAIEDMPTARGAGLFAKSGGGPSNDAHVAEETERKTGLERTATGVCY